MEAVVYLQPALILQHRPYRETSLLLDVFTRDFGIISVLAKGVRKQKSKLAGVLLPFLLLNISYLDKTELKTLTQAEYVGSYPMQRLALYCGFYVNELLQIFLHKNDPYPELFSRYQSCLQTLSLAETIEETLRYFELDLMLETGYGVQLDIDSNSGITVQYQRRYNFVPGFGMVEEDGGLFSGQTLLTLAERAPLYGIALSEAKLLSRKTLDAFLQGRPLKSREVLAKIIQYL